MEVPGLLQHVHGHSQTDQGGHGGQVEKTGADWDDLRQGGDEGDAELQVRLDKAPFNVLRQE